MRLLLAIALLLGLSAQASAEDLALRVELETLPPSGALHPSEMLRIVIRGDYKIPITLEKLEQPDFEGFDWMQLGVDHWFETTQKGQRVVSFERRMALFPRAEGTFTIQPFRHVLTLSRPNGDRYEQLVTSDPVTVSVTPQPEGAEWWFPLQDIAIDDSWSNAPQLLGAGEGALRKITLTVEGVQPEMIPPMPQMTGAGVDILPHPEVRRTLLRARGPVTQVFWRWSLRPTGNLAGWVDPIDLTYFDSKARETRTITLSAQRVAYADAQGVAEIDEGAPSAAAAAQSSDTADGAGVPARWLSLGGLLAGLALGGALMTREFRRFAGSDLIGAIRAKLRRLSQRISVTRAIAKKDGLAARSAALDYLGERTKQDGFQTALRDLDAALFGSTAASPDLSAFGRAVRSAAAGKA